MDQILYVCYLCENSESCKTGSLQNGLKPKIMIIIKIKIFSAIKKTTLLEIVIEKYHKENRNAAL